MKWFRILIERFKKLFIRTEKQEIKEEIVPVLQHPIHTYSPIKLTDYTDKTSYEYIVSAIKNSAKDIAEYSYNIKYRESIALELWEISEQAERTLLVMIMGEFKTGKSTFINAILGEEILKSDVTPSTAVVTMLSYGENKGVLVHFKDGTQEVYSVEELETLTAEGDDEKATLRESIKYVELFLPHPLLRQLTIVDTPGLNVDNNKHIEATKEFMNNADLVIWVFGAGRAASQTEMASIKELGKRLKPMAVINRIDEIDEEEESVEDVINELQKRLKGYVINVIGISAFLAQQAQVMQDDSLLKESNWIVFKKEFERNIVLKSDKLKKGATISKLGALLDKISIELKIDQEEIKELENMVYNYEDYKASALKHLNDMKEVIIKLTDAVSDKPIGAINAVELDTAFENYNKKIYQSMDKPIKILAYIEGYKELFKRQELYEQIIASHKKMWEQVDRDFDSLKVLKDKVSSMEQNYTAHLRNWEDSVDKFNNSGIFGGRPIFDLAGNGERLEKEQEGIERERERVYAKKSDLSRRRLDICYKIVRFNKEIYDFIENTLLKELIETREEMEKDIQTSEDRKIENKEVLRQTICDKDYIVGIVKDLEDIVCSYELVEDGLTNVI